MLSDDSDSGGDLDQITINEHYAKAYAYRKERQELERLKEKYGSDAEEGDEGEEDSEELESEDEDGEELTPGVDAAILRTLAKIKRRDPEIYDGEKAIFEEEKKKTGQLVPSKLKTRKDKSKPVTLRQEKLAAELAFTSRTPSPDPDAPKPLTHIQEQKKLRDETLVAFHTAVSGDASDEDDLLVPREKSKDELQREEEEYQEFLRREVGEDLQQLIEVDRDIIGIHENAPDAAGDGEGKSRGKKKDKGKEKKKGRPKTKEDKEKEDQEFLMNYILSRGWIDRGAKRLPTYTEVTSTRNRQKKSKAKGSEDEEDAAAGPSGSSSESEAEGGANKVLEDEDEFDDVADVFESSYNFRFEEPSATEIARHPRNLTSTVRRQDTTRKEARERRKSRKEEEVLQKREEVKRLKALKLKELRRKLEQIGKEGGLQDVDQHSALQDLDLEGDWDPDAHDSQMAGIYTQDDEGYYDGEKPTWDDDIEIDDIVPPTTSSKGKKKSKKDRKKGKTAGHEDEDNEMGEGDEAYGEDGEWDDEEWDGTEDMRKEKLQKYMDSLFELEFNDVVAGIPTRFKYTTSTPQTFGLTPAEILMADNKDLNQYMGIKKYAPYRKGGHWDKQRPERLKEFRDKMNTRNGNGEDGEVQVKKRKGKKERQRAKAVVADGTGPETDEPQAGSKEKKRKREEPSETAQTEAGPEAGSSKKRRRHKKSSQPTLAE